ncbi:MAG TPA: hypothetical protein VFS08_10320, partial [Gemmatimonadaceae bacterium]|nr:hypothetical protein [Gemmatimonadaceae bacterium]
LVWRPVAGDAPTQVTDFTLLGDTLVVLDARDHRVRLLRPDRGAWRVVGAWGRRGGGPGEFQRPAAIARAGDDRVAVLDGPGRIQLFDPAGRLIGAERAAAPCAMFAPVLAYGDDTRWLAGNCAPSDRARDTIFTMLFAAHGDGEYREVARRPRMAVDLSWGSAFATQQPLVDERDAIYFGTGLDDCVDVTPRLAGPTPRATRRCGLALERLHAPEPAAVARQRRQAQQRGRRDLARLLRWPDALPPYVGLVRGPAGLLLARPINNQDMVLVRAGEPFDVERALLAAPLVPFVACKRGLCLWYDELRGLATFRPDDVAASQGMAVDPTPRLAPAVVTR